jgi:hypothetical protein
LFFLQIVGAMETASEQGSDEDGIAESPASDHASLDELEEDDPRPVSDNGKF